MGDKSHGGQIYSELLLTFDNRKYSNLFLEIRLAGLLKPDMIDIFYNFF